MPLSNPSAPDVVPSFGYQPEDYGYLAWNWPPEYQNNTLTTTLNTAGRLNVFGVVIPRPITCTNIVIYVTTAGATLTANQCAGALYTGAGALIAQTGNQATAWTTTGIKTMALTGGPFALAAGRYDVALWYNGTTAPGLFRANGTAEINVNLTLDRQRLANTTITTTAPATLGNPAGSGSIPFWVALS
jgi:hypothetical protein